MEGFFLTCCFIRKGGIVVVKVIRTTKTPVGTGEMAQWLEHSLYKHEDLTSNPQHLGNT